MKAYTDYPDLVMRPIKLVGYDHDKYVQVEIDAKSLKNQNVPDCFFKQENGKIGAEIKQGYIYRTARKRPIKHETLGRKFPVS